MSTTAEASPLAGSAALALLLQEMQGLIGVLPTTAPISKSLAGSDLETASRPAGAGGAPGARPIY